jgi:hypothetical protein
VGDALEAVVEVLVSMTVLRELFEDCQGPVSFDELYEVV